MWTVGLETSRTSGWRGNMGHILEGLFNHEFCLRVWDFSNYLNQEIL